jgi:integrase/recombinase XerC
MIKMDLGRITAGVSRTWAGYLRDWDRTLRAANHPATTRYNYLLAAAQLGRYLAEHSVGRGSAGAADDPCAVTRAQVEAFQAWMIETRSAATALNKHKGLQQFFRWLVDDERDIPVSPMLRVPQPVPEVKVVPIMDAADTRKVLDTCRGRGFLAVRDEALIRLYVGTGARLTEVANLTLDDLDLNTDSVLYHGKGGKERRVRFGPRAARAVSRYLRLRAKRRGADLPQVWLAERGGVPLTGNGIKLMLKRRGAAAGVSGVHAHRWRHSFAHEWKLAGGDTGDLMIVMGWSSEEMARRYGASAAAERAGQAQQRMGIGERF